MTLKQRGTERQRQRPDADEADPVPAVVDAFRRILRELRVVARKSELAAGLSPAQVFVLSAVIASPGCSMNDVAEATMTDRSSVAAVVDRLAAAGMVTRKPSGRDRRRASIEITARGSRAMRQASPPPTALLLAALRHLSPEELRGLRAGLLALTREMGIAHQPAGMLFEESPRAAAPRPRRSADATKAAR